MSASRTTSTIGLFAIVLSLVAFACASGADPAPGPASPEKADGGEMPGPLAVIGLGPGGGSASFPVSAPPKVGAVAIRGGTVLTMAGETIEGGTVVLDEGKIVAVGRDVAIPAEAEIIEAAGRVVMPGLIDAYTSLGLVEIGAVEVTRDASESSSPVTPQMRVIDAFHPGSELIPIARLHGVTCVLSVPGEGNVFSGQSAVFRLAGDTVNGMALKAPAAVHMNFGQSAKGEGPGRPETRMGIAAIARATLEKARSHGRRLERYRERLEKWEAGELEPGDEDDGDEGEENGDEGGGPPRRPRPPERDLVSEALLPALAGEVPVIARAQRADDILTAVRVADEFGLRLVIARGAEAWQVADVLAGREIPVIVGPVTTQPGSLETLGAIYENAARLHAAGVRIAIMTGDSHNVRNLPFQAGLAVTYGLPREAALRAVTVDAAEILGVADRIGTLEVGKSADVIVVDGDPLQPLSRLEHVIIGGMRQPLESRQTRLADRYR